MKKSGFLAVLIVFLLIPMACSFPSTVATPSSDSSQAEENVEPTKAPQVEPTTAPTKAPQPSRTVAPTKAPTPTEDAYDEFPSSGAQFEDPFTDTLTGWEIGDYDSGSVGYGDGYYYVTATEQSAIMWGVGNVKFQDSIVDVDVTQIQAPSNNNNAFGLFCRYSALNDNTNGYLVMISGDGYYSIMLDVNGDYSPLIDWTRSDAIYQGNTTNHLAISCVGDEIYLFVNGQFVDSTTDETFSDGYLAMAALSFENEMTEIHFSNFMVSIP